MDQQDVIGDFAFNVMDYLLHHAIYSPGLIVLRHKRDVMYCYDLKQLKLELVAVTSKVVKQKHDAVPQDIVEIAQNAIEEYASEIARSYRAHKTGRVARPLRQAS